MASKKLFFLFCLLFCMFATKILAYDIEVKNADGVTIYYNYINDGKELEVTSGVKKYGGSVVIPEEVTYMNRTRKVASIEKAFYYCSSLTSITIPNSVTSIGYCAFQGCSALTSVHISDLSAWCKLKFDGGYSNPLLYAHHLYLNNQEVINLVVPEDVTCIGNFTFYGCSSLTSVTIPNSVTSIEYSAFRSCNNLTSITIPQSMTSIGESVFKDCSSLISVTIPNSVTRIEKYAFAGCSSLTSITIPNSVTRIGYGAFMSCSSLKSITIPSSVTRIGDAAFKDCIILEVISKIKNPFTIYYDTFSQATYINAELYVPAETIDKYKATEGWKNFVYIEEGYPSGIEKVFSKAKLIQSKGGELTVQNIKNGTQVNVYNADGSQVGSVISQNGQATINTNLQPGSVAIVKIGDKSIKIIIK